MRVARGSIGLACVLALASCGYDARGTIVPGVAVAAPTFENGGISRDGWRMTYHLRRDARWAESL